jgi:hypothetical protein
MAGSYNRITNEDIDYVCSDCGNKHSEGWPEGHVCTWHENNCDVCGKFIGVCNKRAWIRFKLNNGKKKSGGSKR